MDDDGSVSPVEEAVAEDDEAACPQQEECDSKLVVKTCFIINTDFPKQRKVNPV